ncbi:single-stranded DNA-binding protein [Nocardiopsis quinghaiensis]|uniref:single-stranded DNA-binding protein n=1 Tax=Nocardiopsis quinghaiensis TaxID=464995 RepID=UPI00123C473D|nr:single-stranded DNA-binding protein [Nocardiopsis quinghaiensis]
MQQESAAAPIPAATHPRHQRQTRPPSEGRRPPATPPAVGTFDAVPDAGPGARAERDPDHRNEVLVAGRITAAPLIRELPSGDRLATWRICVVRPSDSRYGGRRVDSITCTSFDHGLHERVRAWRLGDVVRMTGELRRRTWRAREGVRSVCEVEARTAALVRAVGGRGAERR